MKTCPNRHRRAYVLEPLGFGESPAIPGENSPSHQQSGMAGPKRASRKLAGLVPGSRLSGRDPKKVSATFKICDAMGVYQYRPCRTDTSMSRFILVNFGYPLSMSNPAEPIPSRDAIHEAGHAVVAAV